MRSMFYNVIVLDHMLYKTTIYVFYKIQTWCFRKQFFSLPMYSTSTDHGSDNIQIFYGQLLHFCKNCIACTSPWFLACFAISFSSDDSSAFRLLVLLKGKDSCRVLYLPINDFATTILKLSKEIELTSFAYTM